MVPKLRFPAFRDAGAWVAKTLGNISTIVRGGSPRPIESFLTSEQNGLNWLKIGDVGKNSKYVTHTQERVRIEALSKTREVNPGDLILSNSMSFGRPYILKIKACIHDGWIAVTQIDTQIDRDYLFYLILSPSSQVYFSDNAAGSGVQNLSSEIIRSLPAFTPSLPEQQKIADCLTSIDDLITAEAQKLEILKIHKKGLMQQLFPAKGETRPKLRFPAFRDAGAWVEKRLGEVVDWITTNSLSRDRLTYDCGHVQNIHYGDIHKKFGANFRQQYEEIPFIKNAVRSDFREENFCQLGDVVIADASEDHASIGKTIEIFELGDTPLVAGLHTYIARPVPCALSLGFSGYLLRSTNLRRQIMQISQGISVLGISKDNLKNLTLNFPSLPEQQKIADCLTSIDDLITAEAQKLEVLKIHKKGLMQQLFPAKDEAGGSSMC